jgi:hypothetical protein
MGTIKARVDRLHRGGLGEKARLKRHWERRFAEKEAAFLYFLSAFTEEFWPTEAGEKAWGQIKPWLVEIHHQSYLGGDAPLVARLACVADWHGWFPSPLPAAWVRAVLDHPTAEKADCPNCGLIHPSGGYTWKDCRPVFAPPHSPHCLHCGEAMGEVAYGEVAQGYYQRHNARHPYPAIGLGKFLLKGGDPNQFDPLRKTECKPSRPSEPSPSPAAAPAADAEPPPSA